MRSLRHVSFLLVVLPVGCSGEPSFPDLHPLTGTVTRDGSPTTEGGLIFVPEAGGSGLIVNANVRPDGTFTAESSLTSRDGKTTVRPGAPVGRYKAVFHPPSDGSKAGLEVELERSITVVAGSNAVALTLPLKMPQGHGAERDDIRVWPATDPKGTDKE